MGSDVSNSLRWQIVFFEKINEEYVGSADLPTTVTLGELQELWNQPEDEQMIYVYPVTAAEQVIFLEKVLQVRLDLEKYDYFLEPG